MNRIPLQRAALAAASVMRVLAPMCDKIELAGSIRRRQPFVGDIDIVLLPKPGERDSILKRAGQNTKLIKGGEQYQVFEMVNGMQLDLWFAHAGLEGTKDMFGTTLQVARPSNFGMLLLSRTGSFQHNIFLCQQATSLGMHLNPHVGITRRGEVVASETEEDIFAALKMAFVPPERRER